LPPVHNTVLHKRVERVHAHAAPSSKAGEKRRSRRAVGPHGSLLRARAAPATVWPDLLSRLTDDVEVGVEGGHDVARVGLQEARERRHGARRLGLGQEAHQPKHRKAAVVDLGEEALRLLLGRGRRGELERIEQVEGHRVRQLLEGGEVARLAAAHVVRLAVRREHIRVLAPELEEADGQDDLPLGRLGDGVPQRLRRDARRHAVGDLVPRESDVVRVHNVANEAGHRDAAVLDLSLAKEANGGLLRVAPELGRRQVERVPVANERVELLGQALKARLVHHADSGAAADAGGRRLEGGRSGEAEGERHGEQFLNYGFEHVLCSPALNTVHQSLQVY